MEQQDVKFFKIAIASVLGLLVLLLITAVTIAAYSSNVPTYQQTTTSTNYATAPTEWSNLDKSRYQPEEQRTPVNCNIYPCAYQENMNSPPCTDPCKVRVEYTNKYFLPYPKYTYDRYYNEPYYAYPTYSQPHYALNQRFFHHRIVQSDYTY
ncbi:MAG: hypothetical protein Q8L34_05545 [Candidatus Woesearchaeota archaeon]|nr:hypothetical protein [Candidatus Woesearchaeota archaeon]